MKIWWVLGGHSYYPDWDNFQVSFYTEEEANEYVSEQKMQQRPLDWYLVINISDRLNNVLP